MTDCLECSRSEVWCLFEDRPVCSSCAYQFHLTSEHCLGVRQNKIVEKRSEDNRLIYINDRSLYLEAMANPRLEVAAGELNTKMIPVIIEGNIFLFDLDCEILKRVNYDLRRRVGFSMNIFNKKLLVIGGMISFNSEKNIIDVFSGEFGSLCCSRSFHSSVVSHGYLFVIGGNITKNDPSVEIINLNDPSRKSVINIRDMIFSPVSLCRNNKIYSKYCSSSDSDKDSLLILDLSRLGDNQIRVEHFNIDRIQGTYHNLLLDITRERSDYWTPFNIISIDHYAYFYKPMEWLIAKINIQNNNISYP